jgi:anti-sigma B factor antagonist
MAASSALPAPELKLTAETNPAGIVFHCAGRITATSTSLLQEEVRPQLSQAKRVVLDLSKVDYVDSSGLGAIVRLWTSARKANCEFKVTNLTPRLKDLFTITNLSSVFEGVEHGGM